MPLEEIMNKYEEALNEIKESYDAYFIGNKYGEGTHKKQFDLLSTLEGDKVKIAIAWIRDCYDCYYKSDFENEEGTAFEYLRNICKKYEGDK